MIILYTCNKCGEQKDKDEFSDKQFAHALNNEKCECKQCVALKNLPSKKRSEWQKQLAILVTRKLKEEIGCQICKVLAVEGKSHKHILTAGKHMDFDHLRDKKHNIAGLLNHRPNMFKVMKEARKCQVLCCHCHADKTQEEWNRKKAISIEKGTYVPQAPHVKRNYQLIKEAKSHPCYICNFEHPITHMQLDHVRPMKGDEYLCRMANSKTEKVIKELTKVKPICIACHRDKSFSETVGKGRNQRKNDPKPVKTRKCDKNTAIKKCNECLLIKPFKLFGIEESLAPYEGITIPPECLECKEIRKQRHNEKFVHNPIKKKFYYENRVKAKKAKNNKK